MRNTAVCLLPCLLVLGLAGIAFGDLVAQWNFDEGSGALAKDSSGHGHDGKINRHGVASFGFRLGRASPLRKQARPSIRTGATR